MRSSESTSRSKFCCYCWSRHESIRFHICCFNFNLSWFMKGLIYITLTHTHLPPLILHLPQHSFTPSKYWYTPTRIYRLKYCIYPHIHLPSQIIDITPNAFTPTNIASTSTFIYPLELLIYPHKLCIYPRANQKDTLKSSHFWIHFRLIARVVYDHPKSCVPPPFTLSRRR